MDSQEIKDFLAERKEVLMSMDVDKIIEFSKKWNNITPGSRKIAEIGMHKARTGAMDLPFDARMYSKRWLAERGYTSLDDGDLVDG